MAETKRRKQLRYVGLVFLATTLAPTPFPVELVEETVHVWCAKCAKLEPKKRGWALSLN